ncbi:FERM, ARHGEF and pleckstrin domain-containing protein 1 isoform X2 [Folsomia candida]|uniref:FERM, ARHGEF and pleckstrin domain-containing protein 1 isoform X2 n=1 Tax=Folsomia candida TaxID=158441 RepID=UPI000B905FF5|nr:FERM, ARHGEF and pleckstrin domain-containing protein 1 isoform X2 [Folsomia candida]
MTTTTTTTRPPPVTRSYSTPDEHTTSPDDFLIRSKTPPTPTTGISSSAGAQNKNGNGKMVAIKVLLLDDSVTIIQAQSKTLGRLVFTQICKQLNILESDYFGLEYLDTISNDGITHWLDLEKRLSRQVGLNLAEPFLKFSVKFYTPDPSQLEEEFTRYLFSLQIKRDLAKGVLVCNDNTAALMASFIVQAECGDFSEEDYADASYLSVYKFVPHQNYELERKIRECHKKHISQSPAEADLHLLETARRTEMYGIRLHPARDEDGVHLSLSVCHMGVLVFQNNTKINTFSWAKIRKISFKRKRFILKLHPETYGYYKELVEFIFDSRNECKAYWKRCVEHHAFFRCEKAPNPIHRSKGILSSRGSSFRYSGRTQKQMVQFVRENFIKRPPTSASGGQYLSQQNLSTFENQQQHGHQGGRNFQGDLFQRSSSFKKYDPKSPLTSAQPTRRSTGNIDFDSRNLTHDDGDELDDDDEEFSDYHIDSNQQLPPCPPSTQQSLSLRNQQKTQQQQSPTGSSITSSPIPQNNHPHPHSTQPMESTEDSYYSTKLLLNHYRSYLTDLYLLTQHSLLTPLVHPLLISIQKLDPAFTHNISTLKKHNWELKHGKEIHYKLKSHFHNNHKLYKDYYEFVFQNYSTICKDATDFYVGLEFLVLKVWWWVERVEKWAKQFSKILEVNELCNYGNGFLGELLDIGMTEQVQRDVLNVGVWPVSKFLRQGVLLKLNKKRGLQGRTVFLFLDKLIYCTRISSSSGFRLHGLIYTSQMEMGEESSTANSNNFTGATSTTSGGWSFVINVKDLDGQGCKILVLSAFSEEEKTSWIAAIKYAISHTTQPTPPKIHPTFHSSDSFTDPADHPAPLPPSQILFSRPNLPSHVCYHRNLSISSQFLISANRKHLCSYLLRKFKSAPGWQRLWVVYANICLYFYKSHDSHEGELPLASLPLLGYKVEGEVTDLGGNLNEEKEIGGKKNVFKLGFKNHVYYFRAESGQIWEEWVQVLSQLRE